MPVLKLWSHDPHPVTMRRSSQARYDYWAFCFGCLTLLTPGHPPRPGLKDDQEAWKRAEDDLLRHEETCVQSVTDAELPEIDPQDVPKDVFSGPRPDDPRVNLRWTPEEDAVVQQYKPLSAHEILHNMGKERTLHAVRARREVLTRKGVRLSNDKLKKDLSPEGRKRRARHQATRAGTRPVICPACSRVFRPNSGRSQVLQILDHWDGPCGEEYLQILVESY